MQCTGTWCNAISAYIYDQNQYQRTTKTVLMAHVRKLQIASGDILNILTS